MSEPLQKEIWINAPRGVVFDYLVDADEMVKWCGVSARLDPRPGGIYELDMGAAGTFSGRFLEVIKPERVVYEVDAPQGMDLPPSRVEITLSEEATGTRLKVVHSGLSGPFPGVAARGWDHHLARLSVAAQDGAPGVDPLCNKPMQSLMDKE